MWYSLRINKYCIIHSTKKHYAGKNETRQCGSQLYATEEPNSSPNETKTKRSWVFTEGLWYLSKVDCTSVLIDWLRQPCIWLPGDYSTSVFAHWQSNRWLASHLSGGLSYVSATHVHLSSIAITKLHVKYDIRLNNRTQGRKNSNFNLSD